MKSVAFLKPLNLPSKTLRVNNIFIILYYFIILFYIYCSKLDRSTISVSVATVAGHNGARRTGDFRRDRLLDRTQLSVPWRRLAPLVVVSVRPVRLGERSLDGRPRVHSKRTPAIRRHQKVNASVKGIGSVFHSES